MVDGEVGSREHLGRSRGQAVPLVGVPIGEVRVPVSVRVRVPAPVGEPVLGFQGGQLSRIGWVFLSTFGVFGRGRHQQITPEASGFGKIKAMHTTGSSTSAGGSIQSLA